MNAVFWLLAIVVFGLLLTGRGLPVPPAIAFLLFVILAVWTSVRLLAAFIQCVAGHANDPCARRHVEIDARKTCRDPHCGRTNAARARFCAQCGKPLGGSRSGGPG